MKFLAIDTSGPRLAVVAVNEQEEVVLTDCDCAQQYSVRLMGEIENALDRAHMSLDECDFFACVVGPGSFTGIRIGIATVKGLCFATEKPAVKVTSFETLAYAEKEKKRLALIPAGHGNFYACGYGAGAREELAPAFVSGEQAAEWVAAGYEPCSYEACFEGACILDTAKGLLQAAKEKAQEAGPAQELFALYLRKSSAEERL